MERVIDVGHVLLVLFAVGFLYTLIKSLKDERSFGRFVVLAIIGTIILTMLVAKGG